MNAYTYDALENWEAFLADASAKLKQKREEIEKLRDRIWKMLREENGRK